MSKELTRAGQQELLVSPESAEPTLAQMMQIATQGNNIEILERLVALKERQDARTAKRAFDEAMLAFQEECPLIEKKKDGSRTNSGQVVSKYAPLEFIIETVKPLLKRHRFAYAIKTDFPPKGVRATVSAKHADGHGEETSVEIPLLPKTNVMTEAQQTSATITFAKRLAFTNAFGIICKDEDRDGGKVVGAFAPLTEEQRNNIADMLHQINNPKFEQTFWEYLGVQGSGELHAANYRVAMNMLLAKTKAR